MDNPNAALFALADEIGVTLVTCPACGSPRVTPNDVIVHPDGVEVILACLDCDGPDFTIDPDQED